MIKTRTTRYYSRLNNYWISDLHNLFNFRYFVTHYNMSYILNHLVVHNTFTQYSPNPENVMYFINLYTKNSNLINFWTFANNYLYESDDVLLTIIKDRSHRFFDSRFHRQKLFKEVLWKWLLTFLKLQIAIDNITITSNYNRNRKKN